MKACLARCSVKQKLFISLLFSLLIIISFSFKTNAQGWTFTFQMAQSGPCPAGVPLPILPTFPNFGFPTQGQCESLRQTILSIRESFPVTNDRGNYIGDCAVFYSCTPCTGSDIVIANQTSPGDVSFNSQYTGEPLYTSHESSAFEDWSLDYRQQLESYGITSILGNTLTAPQIPLTGDPEFDAFYNTQTTSFNPTTSPASIPANLDANVVDLSGKLGVVQLLRSPGEQAMLDRQYQNNLNDQGYTGLTQMDPADPEIFDGPKDNQKKEVSNAAVAEFTLDAIGDVIGMAVGVLVPEAGLPSFIQSFGTNLAQATPANIQSGLNAISGAGSPNDVKDPGQLVISSYINTCTLCKWALTPIKY